MSARRVLLADDHALVRSGVRSALEAGGFCVCAEAADAPAALAGARRERPDVCLLDIHMPGGGIAAAAAICAELPQVAVVMLTVSRDDADLVASLRAGAVGYLLKDTDPARLPAVLEAILAGESVLPRGVVRRLAEEFRPERRRGPWPDTPAAALSSREWEVLVLMQDGLTNREIAQRLVVSPVTVRRHVGAILRKLRVQDRDAAVRLLEE